MLTNYAWIVGAWRRNAHCMYVLTGSGCVCVYQYQGAGAGQPGKGWVCPD
jgi:hypothetical protein